MDLDFRDRQYVSLFSTDVMGLMVNDKGDLSDVEGSMVASLVREADQHVVFTRDATRVEEGTYEITPSATETSEPGNYTLVWQYVLNDVAQRYETYLMIGDRSPNYDALAPQMRDVVDTCWIRFADAFDAPHGGPNLQTYFMAHFSRDRLAQLMRIAIGRLNTMSQPYMTYTIDGDGGASFPVDRWGPMLETSLYIETLKHLIRSYVEQPMFMGSGAVSRLDRRDYMQRWQEVLAGEESMFRAQLDTFKMQHMMLGRPKVLVSGGVYGRYAPTRIAGSVAARPRYWTRFY